jgi:hypothetical protein
VKTAVLVEFERTDAGLRHTHICDLGSIREAQQTAHYERVHFWESVEKNLGDAGIDGNERRVIEKMLQIAVPRPTKTIWGGANRQVSDIGKRLNGG